MYCTNSSPTMSSNIVAFNTKGIYRASGGLVLRNNCVYSNTAYNYLGSGLSAGPTDISVDPLFVNRPLDLHILPVSPCRDTGDDASIISGWVDMDGEARIQGAHVDIGADELWQTSLIWPKLSVDGSSADFGGVVVTAVFDGFFYVESKDRACGMRVVPTSGAGPQVGTIVRLIGTVRTNTDAERYLEATKVTPEGTGALAPLTMRIPRVGGQGWYTGAFPGIGQAGVEGGVGLNTIGLFVRTFGTVVNAESGFVTIAETITQGAPVSVMTLALPKGVPEPSPGSFVTVTGISSCAKSGNTIHPILLVPDASSITLAARS